MDLFQNDEDQDYQNEEGDDHEEEDDNDHGYHEKQHLNLSRAFSEISVNLADIYHSERADAEYLPTLGISLEDLDQIYHEILFRKKNLV